MNDHKILHLVIDLTGFGGAEMTLLRYLSAHPNAAAQHRIIALRALRAGPSVGARLREKGLVVETLGIEGLADLPRGLIRLIKILRDSDAHILSAWLYYPALIATLLRPFLKAKPRLIWHIRSLPYGTIRKKPLRWLTQHSLAFLSSRSWISIISNSTASKEAHAALGYDLSNWHVIPNAIDSTLYHPNEKAREHQRSKLQIEQHHFVVGTVGRDVPEKGLTDLFDAFALLYHRAPETEKKQLILMVVGRGISRDAPRFAELLERNKIPEHAVRLLGPRDDVPQLMNVFDCFVMSSHSESFPNVLAEAMATARACISTTVGDCALVLDDERYLVPPQTPEEISQKIEKIRQLSEEERHALGNKNRERVIAHYAPEIMIKAFNQIFEHP
jgi:glycosyltransferase involved in cell wall biosynthesis